MKENSDLKTTNPANTPEPGEKNISQELEDEIYERHLLAKLDCIEKLNKGRNKRNIFIVHPNNGMIVQFRELALELENGFNVYGLKARGLRRGTQMPESPGQLINDYLEQITTLQKKGPYIISGFCGGNTIAYEIARQLEKRNRRVEKVILLDSHVFITDHSYKLVRLMKYLPAAAERWFTSSADNIFKAQIRRGDLILRDTDDDALRVEKVQKYMDVLCAYTISYSIIDAPLLVPQAIESPRPIATQERFDRITRSQATLIKVPGTHDGILEQPYVRKLAEVILNS